MKNSKGALVAAIVILSGAVVYLLLSDRTGKASPPLLDMNANAGASAAMAPQVPAALTDSQKAQLAAGAAAHENTTLTFDITGGNFYFAPNEIRAKEGDTVKIVFTNAGGTHNLVFDDPKISTKTIKTGETDTIEFKASKKGVYEFYCSVGNGYHRQMGQIGVLLVE